MSSTLKQVRRNLGISQKECADIIRMPVKTLQKWEQEIREPSDWVMDLVIEKLLGHKTDEELFDTHHILPFSYIKDNVIEITSKYDVNKVYLFGSYAKGEATEDSDIDIYIESDITGLRFFGLNDKLREKLHKGVDLVSTKNIDVDSEIYQEIQETGIVIYEK